MKFDVFEPPCTFCHGSETGFRFTDRRIDHGGFKDRTFRPQGLRVEARVNDKLLVTIRLAITVTVVMAFGPCRAEETKTGDRPEPAAVAKPRIDFIKDVQPLFQRACLPCHGPDKQKGDYRLDVRETALSGGESYAPNIVSGKSDKSPLLGFVRGTGDLVMPPEGQRLSADEIEVLRAWIDQGAHWPDEVAGQKRDKSDLCSLKPLVRPSVPSLPNTIFLPARKRIAER